MKCERCMQLIEAICDDTKISEEIRDELSWLTIEDLEDGVELTMLLDNAFGDRDDLPEKVMKLMEEAKK